jgi:hypothetical protein
MKFTKPCCARSASVLKRDRSWSSASTFGTSGVDMPVQSVAQKTKPCSFAIARTFAPVTSVALPSSPCP